MNFSLLGFFSFLLLGLSGFFFFIYGHAFVSASLFFGLGILYDRYKTRILFYYGSIVNFMPFFSFLYFCFIVSNFGFPGTINFVGEFLVSVGSFYFSNYLFFFSSIGLVLGLIYSMFFYNRIFFGVFPFFIRFYSDCSRLEFLILFNIFFFLFFFGLFPGFVFSFSLIFLKKLSLFFF